MRHLLYNHPIVDLLCMIEIDQWLIHWIPLDNWNQENLEIDKRGDWQLGKGESYKE